MSYFSSLKLRAQTHPDKVFFSLAYGKENLRELSYSEMYDRIVATAGALVSYGVVRDNIVLIFAQHSAGMLSAFFGAQYMGAVPSFMPPPSQKQDLLKWAESHSELVERLKPAVIIYEPSCKEHVTTLGNYRYVSTEEIEIYQPDEDFFQQENPESIAFLQHSSGTTGLKKGVTVTYSQLISQLTNYGSSLGISSDHSSIVSWLPLYHDMGLIAATLLPFYFGLPVKIIDTFSWLADPSSLIYHLSAESDAFCWMPNFAFRYLAKRFRASDEGLSLTGVRAIINCSEPCKIEDMRVFSETFKTYGLSPNSAQICYAMAEYVFAVTQTKLNTALSALTVDSAVFENEQRVQEATDETLRKKTILSVGSVIPETNILIGGTVHEGVVGEVTVSGTSLSKGYFKNPDLSAKKFQEGVYFTGDLGFIYKGHLYITGRMDDLIIVRGKNIYAHDLEEMASQVSGIKPGRSVAFGVEDVSLGTQQLIIAAEIEDASRFREIKKELADQIFSKFAIIPTDIILLGEGSLVKTTSGKISRSDNLKKYSMNQFNRLS